MVLLGAVGLLAAGAAPALAAGPPLHTAAPDRPAAGQPAASPAASPARVQLELESLSPAAVAPGDQITVVLRVLNPTTQPVDGARVRLFVNSPVLSSRAAITAWAADQGVQGGDRFAGVAGAERALAAPVPAGGSSDVTITISAAQLRLGSTWGPRGVTIDVLDSALDRLDAVRTFLVWTPTRTALPRAPLTVLAPISAGAPDLGTGSVPSERIASLTAPGGRLARVTDAIAGTATTPVLDAAALDTPVPGQPTAASANQATSAWQYQVRQVASGPGGVAALPLDDADLSSTAAARTGELYATAVAEGRERSAGVLGAAPDVLAWPVDGSVDATALGLAASAGTGAVVLSSAVVDAAPGRVALTVDGERSRTSALVVDGPGSAVLAKGTTADSATGPAAASAQLLAEAAVAARSGTSLVLTTPRSWDPDPPAARTVLATLAGAAWVQPRSLADALSEPADATLAVPASSSHADLLPASGLREAAGALAAVGPVASAVDDPEAFVAPLRERALAATSASWRGRGADWRSGVAALSRASTAAAQGVSVVQGSPVTVISARVGIPVTVANGLDQDVDVIVTVQSSSPRVEPLASRTTTITAGSQQRVQMPVRALASGDAKLTVLVRTRTGEVVGTPGAVQVRVRAGVESTGVAIVGGLVGLVLVIGVIRTVRRVRRSGRPGSGSTGPAGSGLRSGGSGSGGSGSGGSGSGGSGPSTAPDGGSTPPPWSRQQRPDPRGAGAGGAGTDESSDDRAAPRRDRQPEHHA